MKAILALALLLSASTVFAEQAMDPAVLQRAISVIAEQRNAALNSYAIAEAQRVLAEEEIAKLKARISELEKPVDPGK